MEFSLDTALGVIGSVGAAMAVPPICQMIWGRPDLKLAYKTTTEQGARLLLIEIHNRPVRGLLRLLGVRRDSVRVWAYLDIREAGTGRILLGSGRKRLTDTVSQAEGLAMEASDPLPLFLVAVEHAGGAVARSETPGDIQVVALAPGEYTAAVRVGSRDGVIGFARSFVVGTTQDTTAWTDRAC